MSKTPPPAPYAPTGPECRQGIPTPPPHPAAAPIPPPALMSRGPFLLRHGIIGFDGVAVAHGRVDPYARGGGEGVVVVHEAAFGGFDVRGGETVWNRAEAEGLRGGLEGLGVECDCDGRRKKVGLDLWE